MRQHMRILSLLIAILMAFALSGCRSSVSLPSTTIPTASSTPTVQVYDENDIANLTEALEAAIITATENFDAAWAVVSADLLATCPPADLQLTLSTAEANMRSILEKRTAALSDMIDALQEIDLQDEHTAATVAEAEALISEENHKFGEVI